MRRNLGRASSFIVLCLVTTLALDEPQDRNTTSAAEADRAAEFRMLDEFDGKLALEWETRSPEPSHQSLTKHPGNLTIVTQYGSMHLKKDPKKRPPTRNVFLVDNPVQQRAGFVVTTCIESFHPKTPWQQAGLLVFDDEDNYMKFALEANHRARMEADGPGPIWCVLREVDGESKITRKVVDAVPIPKVWLRLTTRGKLYEYATSTDGEEFTVHGDLPWGDGSPAKIGVIAGNGGNRDAEEIEAKFDFFELRSLSPEEVNEPRYTERRRLAGQWNLVSCQIDGNELEDAPLSQFAFTESKVTIAEKERSFEAEYSLDITNEPKQLTMSSFLGHKDHQVKASYAIEDDTLTICFALRPAAEAPGEFETKKGDGRMLVTLERAQEE